MKRLFFILSCYLVISMQLAGQQSYTNPIYVDITATGGNNGTSWNDAYTSLSSAIAQAENDISVDAILVASGIYMPESIINGGSTDRDKSFLFNRSNISVLGGYPSGGGTRNPNINKVTLSGNIGDQYDYTDNCYHVIIFGSNAQNIIFDGFTISDGNADGNEKIAVSANDNIYQGYGGGIYILNSSVFISNIYVTNNQTAMTYNWGEYYGGGIYIEYESVSPVITNAVISGNVSDHGGGIFIFTPNENSDPDIAPVLTNLTISGNNTTYGYGGGIISYNSPAKIRNSIIWNNGYYSIENWGWYDILSFSYCLVEGSEGSGDQWNSGFGNDEGNNIDNNPSFILPVSWELAPTTDGDYHIDRCSPALNSGNNNFYNPGLTPDLSSIITDPDNNTRIFNEVIDMGAYEFQDNPYKNIIYVDHTATGNNDGSSWTDAFISFADALETANNCLATDTILVAAGTYKPEYITAIPNNEITTDRDKSFVILRNKLSILGGYENGGGEIRNPNINRVILSGDIGIENDYSDNCYHVLIFSSNKSDIIMDGFTITGGNADGSEVIQLTERDIVYRNYGGGIYFLNSTAQLSNLYVIGNKTLDKREYEIGLGGGLYILLEGALPTFTNMVVSGNSAYNGGGIYIARNFIPTVYKEKNGKNIEENFPKSSIGVFPSFTNITVAGNKSAQPEEDEEKTGGGFVSEYTSCLVRNSIIWGNEIADALSLGGNGATYSYCIVGGCGESGENWDYLVGYDGGNNIDIDPLFFDPQSASIAPTMAGNYRLSENSPAIDTGFNDYYDEGWNPDISSITVDLDFNSRIYNGTIDMGAYEYTGPIIHLPTAVFEKKYLSICPDESVTLNVILTGEPNWEITVNDGTTDNVYSNIATSPFSISVSPVTTTVYSLISVKDNTGNLINITNENVTVAIAPERVIWTPENNMAGTDEEKQQWNNPLNWDTGIIPAHCTDVYIPGNASHFPYLTGDKYDNSCNNIYFLSGSEVAQPQRLSYSKAHVQMNFGLGDPQKPQETSSNIDEYLKFSASYAASPLKRNSWHMLSAPLHGMVSGDFAFGGYPLTFMRKFDIAQPSSGKYLIGQWTELYTSLSEELNPAEGFIFWMNEWRENTPMYMEFNQSSDYDGFPFRSYGLQVSNGILEFPYHLKPTFSQSRRIHRITNNTSEFNYIQSDPANSNYMQVVPMRDSFERGLNNKAYRFIAESYNPQEQTWIFNPNLNYTIDNENKEAEILIGNPFMSTIDFVQFYLDNAQYLQPQYRLWTGNSFSSVSIDQYGNITSTGEVELDRYISPMQSFFILTKANTEAFDLFFNVENISTTKSTSPNIELRTINVEENNLRIKAENGIYMSETLIGKRDEAHNYYKPEEDVYKLFSQKKNVPEIYTKVNDFTLEMNFIQSTDQTIPLCLKTDYTGQITLTFSGMNNFTDAKQITFLDIKSAWVQDLSGKDTAKYVFNNNTSGIEENRFYILFTPSSNTDIEDNQSDYNIINAWFNNETLSIYSSSSDPLNEVRIYDIQGRIVYHNEHINSSLLNINESIFSQSNIFIVKAKTKNNSKSIKVVKQQL